MSTGGDPFPISMEWVASTLPSRSDDGDKRHSGSVLVVAGSERMPGAATLVALGALRAGAGLVRVAAPPSVCATVASHIAEAMYLPLPDSASDAAAEIHGHHEMCDAAVFGPGLSRSDYAKQMLALIWKSWPTPCVIDADALNAVADGIELPSAPCALTPHAGELGRLLRIERSEIEADRFGAVLQASAKLKGAVLLKGQGSLVAESGGRIFVNTTGNSGMATGGMGDVLAGVVGTLLAQRVPPYEALAAAAFWHGLAADLCADEVGDQGYMPSDLAKHLPQARDTILGTCFSPP